MNRKYEAYSPPVSELTLAREERGNFGDGYGTVRVTKQTMTLKTLKIQFYHLYLTRDVSPDSFCFKRTFSVSSHRGNTVRFSRRGQRGLDENPKSFSALIEKAISRFNGMISRNGGRPLIGVLVKDLG